jgi:hypothetical protein
VKREQHRGEPLGCHHAWFDDPDEFMWVRDDLAVDEIIDADRDPIESCVVVQGEYSPERSRYPGQRPESFCLSAADDVVAAVLLFMLWLSVRSGPRALLVGIIRKQPSQ